MTLEELKTLLNNLELDSPFYANAKVDFMYDLNIFYAYQERHLYLDLLRSACRYLISALHDPEVSSEAVLENVATELGLSAESLCRYTYMYQAFRTAYKYNYITPFNNYILSYTFY